MLIDSPERLTELCFRHRGKTPIGFDTEFVREKTYYPRLEILQIVVDDEIDIVDCQAFENLDPLWDLLCDPDTEKVVHSGSQDMELIYQESGRLPKPLFDTQIAAALLGIGAQSGYGRLVHQLLDKKAPKGETFSDWSRRPLHKDQIKYAQKDVEHLLDLHQVLKRRLEKRGRMDWLEEECEHLTDPETFQRSHPQECFLKVKGRSGLDPTSLSVLRSLCAWRDRFASERNVPPGRILRDHVIVPIAKSKPKSLEELGRQRGLHAGEIGRIGKSILDAVQEGIARAKTDPVVLPDNGRLRPDKEPDGIFKLLSAVLQIQADQAHICPTALATSQDLHDLITGYRSGNLNGLTLLQTWRRELAGDMLLSVMEGKVALRIDPKTSELIMTQVDA